MVSIKEIRIVSHDYIDKGKLRGTIRIATEHGIVQVDLTEEQMRPLCETAVAVAFYVVKEIASS